MTNQKGGNKNSSIESHNRLSKDPFLCENIDLNFRFESDSEGSTFGITLPNFK